jgi:hypothetical protein
VRKRRRYIIRPSFLFPSSFFHHHTFPSFYQKTYSVTSCLLLLFAVLPKLVTRYRMLCVCFCCLESQTTVAAHQWLWTRRKKGFTKVSCSRLRFSRKRHWIRVMCAVCSLSAIAGTWNWGYIKPFSISALLSSSSPYSIVFYQKGHDYI